MSRCQSSLLDGFTDDWDAALLSEGTLRPKRAASAMNLREVMRTLNKPSADVVTRQDLENQFSRSMKLLGFERNEGTASKLSYHKPKISNVSPRTITRLNKQTVSYEDIRNAVTGGVDRKLLSQAAYERWYFRKMEEERDSRKTLYDLEKNRNKLFEHGMTFNEWLEKKNKERKTKKNPIENTQNSKSGKRKLPTSTPATKEAADKAYKDWLNKKIEEEAGKKSKVKEELDKKSPTSREDAEKVFERWKTSYEEKCAKMKTRTRNKEKKAKEKEDEDKERHSQDCQKAFNAWLESKNQLITEKLEKNKKLTMKKSIVERKKQLEKDYEARQAFEDWLEKKLELESSKIQPSDVKIAKSIQTESPPKTSTTPIQKPVSNFPKNLLVPWVDFTAKNHLPSSKTLHNLSKYNKKPVVKFRDSFDSDDEFGTQHKEISDVKSFSKNRDHSYNKTMMMLYHKKDPNSALYYARDLS